MRSLFLASILLLCIASSGCATIIDGRYQDISVDSSPSGARVTRDGVDLGQTPCVISLPRYTRSSLQIQKPGYQVQTVKLEQHFNMTALWDLPLLFIGIAPGAAALVVDALSGAILESYPDQVRVYLKLPDRKQKRASPSKSRTIPKKYNASNKR
jgi:hypothetical protein